MDALNTFTANVTAARNAYNADQAVAAGFCAVCKHRKPNDPQSRRCRTRIDDGRTEGTR